MKAPVIAASVLSADFGRQAEKVRAVDPATPASMIEDVLNLVEIVLVMTVDPGYGGQNFIPEMLAKLRAVQQMCVAHGRAPWIAVDGRIAPATIRRASDAGADAFVVGSAIFRSAHYGDAIAALPAGRLST